MAQSRNKKLAILERRKNAAARYLRGQTQWEIARAFEVDQKTVSNDLKAIQAEWLAEAVLDRGEWTARELARLDEIERSAWAAWSKSQDNAQIIRTKTRGDSGETETTIKGQAGDARFLEIVLKCVAKRCQLLGLDKKPDEEDDFRIRSAPDLDQFRQLPVDERVRLLRQTMGISSRN